MLTERSRATSNSSLSADRPLHLARTSWCSDGPRRSLSRTAAQDAPSQDNQQFIREWIPHMLFDTPHSPGWRHPLMRAATPGMTNRGRGYDPNQPRVPAGHSDGGQWTSIGGNTAASNAFAYAGQRINPWAAGLHDDRARMNAPLAPDRSAGNGDARIQLLPLTDVDPENGWTLEPDYVAFAAGAGHATPRSNNTELSSTTRHCETSAAMIRAIRRSAIRLLSLQQPRLPGLKR